MLDTVTGDQWRCPRTHASDCRSFLNGRDQPWMVRKRQVVVGCEINKGSSLNAQVSRIEDVDSLQGASLMSVGPLLQLS
jgi:hypothetical protein